MGDRPHVRMVCPDHRESGAPLGRPFADEVLALGKALGPVGESLLGLFHGVRGGVDVLRKRRPLAERFHLPEAFLLALRTGLDSRDMLALRGAGHTELSALEGTVPRARRREHREWNNCQVAAARVDDKLLCGASVSAAGIATPFQVPLDRDTRVLGDPDTGELRFSSGQDGELWMLKDRFGLQGESVWIARAGVPEDPGPASGPAAHIGALVTQDRILAQELLRPAAWFAEQGDTALPTVRVVTSRLSGRTETIGTVLFRGAPGAVAAHRRHGGTAHVIAEDGTCGPGIDRWGRQHAGRRYRFGGKDIAALTGMCTEAHDLFPCLGTVGWDVGVSDRGLFLLEGNPNWGMNVPQLLPGRPMLQEFRRSGFRTGRE